MENSACGCECSFVKSGFCKTDKECPFYIESWWQKADDPTPRLFKDCFPKKLAVEQNNLLHRMICSQGVVEEVRNRMDRIEQMLDLLIAQSKEFIIEKRTEKLDLSHKPFQQLELKKDEK